MSETTEAATTTEAEPTTLDGAQKRVGALHEAHAAYIQEHFGVTVDPLHIFLTYSTRNKFRSTEAYRKGVVEQREADRVQAAAEAEEARQKRAQEREAKKAETAEAKAAKAAEKEEARKQRDAEREAKKAERDAAAAAKAAAGGSTDEAPTKAEKVRGKQAEAEQKAAKAPF